MVSVASGSNKQAPDCLKGKSCEIHGALATAWMQHNYIRRKC